MKSYSLWACFQRIIEMDRSRWVKRLDKQHDSIARKVTLCKSFKELKKFPFDIQQTIATEYKHALQSYNNGEVLERLEEVQCKYLKCDIFHKYMLPCRHIFYEYLWRKEMDEDEFLTPEDWESFYDGWEENGYDVYWTREAYKTSKAYAEPMAFPKTDLKLFFEEMEPLYYKCTKDLGKNKQFKEILDAAKVKCYELAGMAAMAYDEYALYIFSKV